MPREIQIMHQKMYCETPFAFNHVQIILTLKTSPNELHLPKCQPLAYVILLVVIGKCRETPPAAEFRAPHNYVGRSWFRDIYLSGIRVTDLCRQRETQLSILNRFVKAERQITLESILPLFIWKCFTNNNPSSSSVKYKWISKKAKQTG